MTKTKNSILVCAQTNSACDEIAERLLAVLTDSSILFRKYARSHSQEKLNPKILKVCNFKNGKFGFPSLDHLYDYRIVICTLQTSGSLVRAREKDTNFNSSHFSHIIIDEAACVPEPVSLIPIAGIYFFIFKLGIIYFLF